MQFGYARTWTGFVHLVSRGQYARIMPAHVFSMKFLEQLGWYVVLLLRQFAGPLAFIGLVPIANPGRFRGPWRRWWMVALLAFVMVGPVLLVGIDPKLDIQDTFIHRVYLLPSFALWAVCMGLGLALLLDGLSSLRQLARDHLYRPGQTPRAIRR